MFYRWACHTTFRSRLKKDPLAYGWARPFLVYDKALVPSLQRTPTDPMIPINEGASGVTFAIKVHPRARKDAITGEIGDALKVSLTATPVEGKANQACVEF